MMQRRTAVVVEDDTDIADMLTTLLDQVGFEVAVVGTGADALNLVRSTLPDLVTLDLTLPDMDGVEVCRQIRGISDCYVMVVSARNAEVDRLVGLEVGADDYLSKPFSLRELQARVAALFRRPRNVEGAAPVPTVPTSAPGAVTSHTSQPAPAPSATAVLGCDDLQLFRHAREVKVAGEHVELTRTEFDLLSHLVSRPGVVVGREELLRDVWSTDFVPDNTHVVDVHLANLRRKLRHSADYEWIRTIRGVGFRFDPCCAGQAPYAAS